MGLAASQARYLALSARKTNVEYEGQQINQQRLTLSNQSANLFNQMLTMTVPTPPSSTDYTVLQYSWTDGVNTYIMESYYQIGTANENYNYVVTSYHYEDVYTGQLKYLSDPQVQATKTNNFSDLTETNYTVNSISYSKSDDEYTFILTNSLGNQLSVQYYRSDQSTDANVTELLDYMYGRTTETGSDSNYFSYDEETDTYTYYASGDGSTVTTTYSLVDTDDAEALSALKLTYGALYDSSKTYYVSEDGSTYICKDDIDDANELSTNTATIRNKDTNIYYTDGTHYISAADIAELSAGDTMTVLSATNTMTFSNYTAIGNCELTQIDEDTYNSDATISIVIEQLLEDLAGVEGYETAYERLKACFDDDGNYISGTLYQFTMNGTTYYTTAADMDESLLSAYSDSATASNSIDSQQSNLAYYTALYVSTKITDTKQALLETDGTGRFSTAKFEDDSVVYTLTVETVTDDDAYNDAMNQYYYEQDKYDKQVSDINAKTEVIHAEDRQLELKLEQLDTEQSALETEMEACQKVVSKSIENSFGAFGG